MGVSDDSASIGPVPVARTIAQVRSQVASWRRAGRAIALVPTMGALHEGHLSLVRAGAAVADHVVVSIFVNPTQFGPNDDFDRYPRREEEDRQRLGTVGTALLFAPPVAEMYPPGASTTVTVGGVSEGLCGDFRPGHFAGVATIVTKLLLQVLPDVALFGEKDYQQLQVIRHLTHDLDIPVRIEGVPTVREADGLAMSSRNSYLAPEERRTAAALYAALRGVATAVREGGASTATACAEASAALLRAGFSRVDYLEVRDADTLAKVETLSATSPPARVLAAAWLGRTRLIDNLPV
ncbi:MAG: pantoate--beta-alanine ligase [Alphaproteobacteria bacterium]